jgi:hypothetical protein
MPRFHPSRDVTPGRDFPFKDMWRVAECLEFVADPERPVAVAARVADEIIGHAAKPRFGTVQPRREVFSSWFARYARPMRQGCPSLALADVLQIVGGPLLEERTLVAGVCGRPRTDLFRNSYSRNARST